MRMARWGSGQAVGGVHWCEPKRTSAEEPWLQCLKPLHRWSLLLLPPYGLTNEDLAKEPR